MSDIQIYSYIKLGIAALFPALAAVIIYYVDKHYIKEKLSYTVKQIIIGVIFGGFAVIGTEWGINIGTAVANARDGAVLIAGLLFGGPAGIIAGLIGGIERWFAVFWGVGSFTRVACTVSTILAGFFAAALRKYMFDNKKINIGQLMLYNLKGNITKEEKRDNQIHEKMDGLTCSYFIGMRLS